MDGGSYVVWGGVLYILSLGLVGAQHLKVITIIGGGVNHKEFYPTITEIRPYYIQVGDIVGIKVLYGSVEVVDKIIILSISRDKVSKLYVNYENLNTGTTGMVSEKDLNRVYLQHIQD